MVFWQQASLASPSRILDTTLVMLPSQSVSPSVRPSVMISRTPVEVGIFLPLVPPTYYTW